MLECCEFRRVHIESNGIAAHIATCPCVRYSLCYSFHTEQQAPRRVCVVFVDTFSNLVNTTSNLVDGLHGVRDE